MDWKFGSSDRAPALQVRIPEFEHLSHKKTKQNKTKTNDKEWAFY
jgi:hypothetical protein